MKLLDHQTQAVEAFVSRKGRMLLWADVGTGKTATAIECARRVRASRVLYLCPAILKSQVKSEFLAWWPTAKVVNVIGPKPLRTDIWKYDADVWIANFEQLNHDIADIVALAPDFVVVDECQRFAAPTSKTLRSFRKLAPHFRLAMSGTPAPNALHELWNMVDWISPGIAHESWWQFRSRECKMHPAFPKILGYYRPDKVKKTFMSVVHRIRREDVLELPPLTEVRIACELGKEQRLAYDTLKRDLMLELRDGERLTVPNMLALIMRLRQMVDLPSVLGVAAESAKVQKLSELLDAFSGRKVLVFTEFSTVAEHLATLHGGSIVTGDTPQKDRDEVFRKFREDPERRLLFLTSAAQYGVNLQVADTVLHFDLPWNDARLEQRTARAWRYGQDKPVTSYRIVAEGTVDEKMERLIESKRKATVDDLLDFFR